MRLTDDEIRGLRNIETEALESLRAYARGGEWPNQTRSALVLRLLDEIEERRRIDARRLADAEQAFREELER